MSKEEAITIDGHVLVKDAVMYATRVPTIERVDNPDEDFTIVYNNTIALIVDHPYALQIYCYLMRKPQHWRIRESEVREAVKIGHRAYMNGIRKLKELKLVDLVKFVDSGTGTIAQRELRLHAKPRASVDDQQCAARTIGGNQQCSKRTIGGQQCAARTIGSAAKTEHDTLYSLSLVCREDSIPDAHDIDSNTDDLTGSSLANESSQQNLFPELVHIPAAPKKTRPTTCDVWDAYAQEYVKRYNVEPIRNARNNGIMYRFITRVGIENAPFVASYYVTHNRRQYIESAHDLSLMLRDAEALYTQAMNDEQITSYEAAQADRMETRSPQAIMRRLERATRDQELIESPSGKKQLPKLPF